MKEIEPTQNSAVAALLETPEMKSLPDSRAKQILAEFIVFHLTHPEVWKSFDRLCRYVLASGRTEYSSKAIFERLRWESEIEAKSKVGIAEGFSNDFTAYYARLFIVTYPDHSKFFAIRRLPSSTGKNIVGDIDLPAVVAANELDDVEESIQRILLSATKRPEDKSHPEQFEFQF
jgi:hypothetical protein